MSKRRMKRIAGLLFLVMIITSLPIFCPKASAAPYRRYTVRYTVKYTIKKKHKKPAISNKKLTFTKGEVRSLTLYNAKSKKVKWSSSNKKIATVKKDGKWCDIKAKKPGKVTITAKYKGKKYKCRVTIKPKQSTAFTSWSHSANETIRFKTGQGYFGDGKAWYMYDSRENSWSSNNSIMFESDLYPITLIYDIGDPNVIEAEWGEYDDDLGWSLNLYPQKAGRTYIRVTNSYNNQTMTFPVVIEDDYVVPGTGFVSLDCDRSFTINTSDQEALVKVRTSNDVSSLNIKYCDAPNSYSYFNSSSAFCYIDRVENKDGWNYYYIKPKKNGTTRISFQDSGGYYKPVEVTVNVKIPNTTIETDVDELNMILGDVSYFNITTDFGPDVSVTCDSEAVSIRNLGWDKTETKCKYQVNAKSEGSANIIIQDMHDNSVCKVIPVNVSIIDVTGVAITNKRSTFTAAYSTPALNSLVFKAKIYPENATYKQLTWETSDPKIASIDSSGILTAINSGTVTVKVTTYNGYSDEFDLKVVVR